MNLQSASVSVTQSVLLAACLRPAGDKRLIPHSAGAGTTQVEGLESNFQSCAAATAPRRYIRSHFEQGTVGEGSVLVCQQKSRHLSLSIRASPISPLHWLEIGK